jgi:hypothetical protein
VTLARAAFVRAHEAVPAELADVNTAQSLALCYFTPPPATPSSVSTCPNGLPRIAPSQDTLMLYAVEANLNAIRLPPIRYLLPVGATVQTSPDMCAETKSR